MRRRCCHASEVARAIGGLRPAVRDPNHSRKAVPYEGDASHASAATRSPQASPRMNPLNISRCASKYISPRL